ncbi:hypothetical protein [Methanohalophilus mahii]|nr:hypothetical protein [Methanohalophilus mahii]
MRFNSPAMRGHVGRNAITRVGFSLCATISSSVLSVAEAID